MTSCDPPSEENKNRVEIAIVTESGCSLEKGEYAVYVTKIVHGMIGADDYGLICECIEEKLSELQLPEEGATGFVLQETGEWDGFPHWMRYYEIAERLGDLSHE